MRVFLSIFCFLFPFLSVFSQTGISVSPPRLYYEADPGQSGVQKVMVSNVSTSHTMDLAVSLGDWKYDDKGENLMFPADSLPTSCASWVTIKKEDTYFSLQPGQNKEIEVSITTPNTLTDERPVHTAMLYVTQMNPVNDVDSQGANIKVSVRSGIKLFHRTNESKNKKLEIENLLFNKETKLIELYFKNKGNIWADGIIYPELFNTQNGKKVKIDHIIFYSMPGDNREMTIKLPENTTPGKYTATILIDYGDDNTIEMAELSFTYE
ncbi:molecular chaperone [Flavobacterium dauae]|uniref:fimbrial biogenesis chaperone n=1 Tax=Flavobacterium dauae TaxID=1563479 RepID=UPI00101B3920|nr:molecular chaperone [Flavobacterium dauae]WLD23427.1 molecular chaperone [Flavobacterium dauae]